MNRIGKKLLFVVAALSVSLSSAAYADTVKIITKLEVAGQPVEMEKAIAFKPTTDVFVVEVAGKKCSFGSSTQGSVPKGCNYNITIDKSGVTPTPSEADRTCMKTPMICE